MFFLQRPFLRAVTKRTMHEPEPRVETGGRESREHLESVACGAREPRTAWRRFAASRILAASTPGVRSTARFDIRRGGFVITPRVFSVDRKSTRLNSSHVKISYAVFCLKKKKNNSSY